MKNPAECAVHAPPKAIEDDDEENKGSFSDLVRAVLAQAAVSRGKGANVLSAKCERLLREADALHKEADGYHVAASAMHKEADALHAKGAETRAKAHARIRSVLAAHDEAVEDPDGDGDNDNAPGAATNTDDDAKAARIRRANALKLRAVI